MSTSLPFLDQFLFVVLPYLALLVFFLGSILRYKKAPFTYSSLSSQFLENREHFWGLVPFHYGILIVLTGHLVASLIPRELLWWNSRPLRLYVLEASALACALLALLGLATAIYRRLTVSRARVVTTRIDWTLLGLLTLQVASGIFVALAYPWGSSWFAAFLAPYLWSLVRLAPDAVAVAALPLVVKLHIALGYVLIGLTPFTRLVHLLVAPLPYLWRRPQVVRWYRRPGVSAAERQA